jgi:hypothetical protein
MCIGLNENNEGLFLMRSAEPGPIGRNIDDITAELLHTDPDVVIYFTNVESLNNVIKNLSSLRDIMNEELNKEEEDKNEEN